MTTTVTIKPRPAVFPDPVTYIVEQDGLNLEVSVTQSGMGYKFEVDAPDASAAEKAIAAVSDFLFTTGGKSGPKVEEISFTEWMNSTELQEKYEFEGTVCAYCRCSLGGYLGYNEETTADVPKFDSIWVLTDLDVAVCEDCIPEGMEY